MTGRVNFSFKCEGCGTVSKASMDIVALVEMERGYLVLYCIKCGKKKIVWEKKTGWEEK